MNWRKLKLNITEDDVHFALGLPDSSLNTGGKIIERYSRFEDFGIVVFDKRNNRFDIVESLIEKVTDERGKVRLDRLDTAERMVVRYGKPNNFKKRNDSSVRVSYWAEPYWPGVDKYKKADKIATKGSP